MTAPTTIVLGEPSDPRFDDYRSLNDQPFRRRHEGDTLFIAEGYVAIDRLIESGHTIRSVLLAPSRVERFAANAALLQAAGVPVFVADRSVIAEVVGFDLHRGVLACAERHSGDDLGEVVGSARRIAMLEGLNDAENVGAIARAARAFGIDALVLDATCTDHYSRRTVRVSMGEVLMLPTVRVPSMIEAIGAVQETGIEVWAMTPSPTADDLWDLDVPDRLAVVLGAEGPGITARTLRCVDRRVRIPIAGHVDSLNVGHAAAVAFAAIGRPITRRK